MTTTLDHTIVHSHDQDASAEFLTEILDLPAPKHVGPFSAVELGNGITLDYRSVGGEITSQHYAFLLSDEEFDAAFARLARQGLRYWADPYQSKLGQIRKHHGSRGLYFEDPSGHLLEIMTPTATTTAA